MRFNIGDKVTLKRKINSDEELWDSESKHVSSMLGRMNDLYEAIGVITEEYGDGSAWYKTSITGTLWLPDSVLKRVRVFNKLLKSGD